MNVDAVVARLRLIAAAMAGGVLLLAGLAVALTVEPVPFIFRSSLPLGLIGLVWLVAGWRLFQHLTEKSADQGGDGWLQRYEFATLLVFGISEGVAMLGAVWFMLGAEPIAATGVVTHLVLLGALWPTAEKAAAFSKHGG